MNMREENVANQEEHVRVGILKDEACIDAAEFERLEDAEAFLAGGVWPLANAVVELEEGFGIGDLFLDGTWAFGANRICKNEELDA